MNAFRAGMTIAVLCLLAPPLAGQTLQPESLSRKQETQKRVRAMARELVAGILDVQLRQLEENELQSTELYKDIRTMREHVDALVEAEMPRLVQLLGEVRSASEDQRGPKFVVARQKSREILVELLAQRQTVLRRLRMAEMAAQVRQLIQSETKVLRTTQALPERQSPERETLTLATIEDQRDVKAMYLRFKETLKEVATWGGPVGAEASGGIRLLETSRVDAEMDSAKGHLERTDFGEAVKSQRAVVKALEALLQIIERAQGLLANDRESIERAIRDLADRQKEIRDATGQPDLGPKETEDLVQQQGDIAKDLDQLNKNVEQSPETGKPLEEAEQAAQAATERLFEGKRPEAVTQQEKVLENLEKAAQQLQQAAPPNRADAGPDRLAQLIKDLEAAKQDVERIQREQDQASEAAKGRPAEAQKQESQIAKELGEVSKDRDLPRQVDSRLAEAQQAAQDAAGEMSRPEPQRRAAAEQAEQAIQRAAAEIDAALADAKRRQLGGGLDELAQALEALEKAAAAERQIAKDAQKAGQEKGLQADQARQLAEQQAGVEKSVAGVAKTVDRAAPAAGKLVAEAAEPIRRAEERLQAAGQRPGEASKPAATEAATQAQQAADKLAQAADKLRQRIAETAQRLAQLADQQLQQVQQAEQAVENALAARPESIGARLDRLDRAEEMVRQAASDQQRAAGRPEAARAMDLVAGIERAIAMQNEADRAAQALADRPAANPLGAISKQQQVAGAAGELAKQAAGKPSLPQAQTPKQGEKPEGEQAPSNPIAEALQGAEKSARGAAKDLMDAKHEEAKQARSETRRSLDEALKLAKDTERKAAEAPAGPPSAALQQRVGEEIAAAKDLAEPDAPQAAQTLEEAGKTSAEAEKQASPGGKPEAAAGAQQATAASLEKATHEIAEAKAQLARQAAEQLAAQAQAADRLADQATPADPGATAALQAAENLAAQGAAEAPQAPQAVQPAEQGVGAAMERAAGELAARAELLARDQAAASQLAAMAAAQRPSDQSSPNLSQGGMARQGDRVLNPPPAAAALTASSRVPQGDSRTGEASNRDPAAPRKSPEEPWIMDLPPELRSAIRANSQRRPPRGYEERLERYFKNID